MQAAGSRAYGTTTPRNPIPGDAAAAAHALRGHRALRRGTHPIAAGASRRAGGAGPPRRQIVALQVECAGSPNWTVEPPAVSLRWKGAGGDKREAPRVVAPLSLDSTAFAAPLRAPRCARALGGAIDWFTDDAAPGTNPTHVRSGIERLRRHTVKIQGPLDKPRHVDYRPRQTTWRSSRS